MPCVLVVDPDVKVRLHLKESLTRAGYRVLEASTGAEALALVTKENPETVLFELDLPDISAETIIARLRTQSARRPLIVISSRSTEEERVAALDLGADDYLTKPFGEEELLARIRVALRRNASRSQESGAIIKVGDLALDLNRRLVFARGQEVHLTPNEYALFAFLMKRIERVASYSELLREIRGPQREREQRAYLRVYMVQLRRKLEANPSRPIYLLTESNTGYRLSDPHKTVREK